MTGWETSIGMPVLTKPTVIFTASILFSGRSASFLNYSDLFSSQWVNQFFPHSNHKFVTKSTKWLRVMVYVCFIFHQPAFHYLLNVTLALFKHFDSIAVEWFAKFDVSQILGKLLPVLAYEQDNKCKTSWTNWRKKRLSSAQYTFNPIFQVISHSDYGGW